MKKVREAATKQARLPAKSVRSGRSTREARDDASVVIRMYNVGFGDAFLVTLKSSRGDRRLLFDCGSIAAGPQPMSAVVEQIVADCTDASGKAKIDVVICTHRHRDHVSGFASDRWAAVEVGEVWMPWTEDPEDAEAAKVRNAQSKLTAALAATMTTATLDLRQLSLEAEPQQNRLGPVSELVLNAMSNAKAMNVLHSGFAGRPSRRFLPERGTDGSYVRLFESKALPGVKVHVLGPSHDPSVIADLDPPQGESYLRLKQSATSETNGICRPFPDEYLMEPDDTPSEFFELFSDDDRSAIDASGGLSDFDAAVALDGAVNGTSLMLVLEVDNLILLFPGDAQWGTWNLVLNDAEWRKLLSRLTFYKVGHHGSHNATPIDFVELLIQEGIIGMASTISRSQWPSIPKEELLTALAKRKAKIARSDEIEEADSHVFLSDGDKYVDTVIRRSA